MKESYRLDSDDQSPFGAKKKKHSGELRKKNGNGEVTVQLDITATYNRTQGQLVL